MKSTPSPPSCTLAPPHCMADNPLGQTDFAPRAGRGITSAVRQRLDAVFIRAKACLERGDNDYAHDLLTQCVAEDPGSLPYAQAFRANLTAKWAGAGKKSSRFGAFVGKTSKGHVAKSIDKGDWTDAFTSACNALKKNPLDISVLRELARGCEQLGHTEVQLFYLRWALDLDLHEVETNRAAAVALAGVKQFDQAIACWQRVLKQKPGDEEANKAISRLSVEQTLHQGGYNHELLSGQGASPDLPAVRVADLAAKDGAGDTRKAEEQAPQQSQEELLAAVEADAKDAASALMLAEILVNKGHPGDALKVVRRALKHSPDAEAPEHARLEDMQLRIAHNQAEDAQRSVKEDRTRENVKLCKERITQSNETEMEVYAARTARQTNDFRAQFELGLRLKRAGRHRDAIKAFQAARGDKRRTAETQVHLGECFQHIEQFKLAASSYEAAVAAADDAGEETRKLALYRAGVLAMGLGDLDRAENRLTELAALDFGYKDVGDRLDNIAELRKNA